MREIARQVQCVIAITHSPGNSAAMRGRSDYKMEKMMQKFLCVSWLLVFCVLSTIVHSQTTLNSPLVLQSPVKVNGVVPGQFRAEIPIFGSCPGNTTSAPGQLLLCSNNNSLLISINGEPPFLLQAPRVVLPQPQQVQLPSPASTTPTDYALTMQSSRGKEEVGDDRQLIQQESAGVPPPRWDDSRWLQADLTNATVARVFVDLGKHHTPAGSTVFIQYSADGGQRWRTLRRLLLGTSGPQVSPWERIPTSARADVLLRARTEASSLLASDVRSVHLQAK